MWEVEVLKKSKKEYVVLIRKSILPTYLERMQGRDNDSVQLCSLFMPILNPNCEYGGNVLLPMALGRYYNVTICTKCKDLYQVWSTVISSELRDAYVNLF